MKKSHAQPNTSYNTGGFSLVETLVAISILLPVVSSIMLLVNQSIDSETRLSNRLVASYLASDAIEYVRSQRDSQWLQNSNNNFDYWLNNASNLSNCDGSNEYCEVDTRVGDGDISQCGTSISSCDKLQYSSSTKRFGYNMGENSSKFTRVMQVQQINDLDSDGDEEEVVIEVVVQWQDQAGNITDLVLTDTLTAWGD
jgi:type II secretory pathway pseudopilin PulG